MVSNKGSIVQVTVFFIFKSIRVLALTEFLFLAIKQCIFIIDFKLPYFNKSINIAFRFQFVITVTHSKAVNIRFVSYY